MRQTSEESITVNLPEWVSPYTFEKHHFKNEYRTTPKPIYIRTYDPRSTRPVRQETDWLNRPTAEPTVTRSLYRPEWNPATLSTKLLTRYPIRTTRKPTRSPTIPRTTRQETTTTTVQEKTLRI